jgi:predicted GNAT family acetyltransferase
VKTRYTIQLDQFYVAIADLYEGWGLKSTWMVSRVNVPEKHRGNGYGSILLKTVTNDADQEGITLRLEIFPSGQMSYEQLEAWYRRNGFEYIDKQHLSYLERPPVQ